MPDATFEYWSYDGEGHNTRYTNGLNEAINYGFDNAGRMILVDYPTGTDTVFTHDAGNRPASMTDATGTTTWTFNSLDELTQLVTPQGTINYAYQVSTVNNTGPWRRSSMTEAGVGTTTHAYDDAGRMSTLTNSFAETTSWLYDLGGRMTRKNMGNGTYTTYDYDVRSRVSGVHHRKSDDSVIGNESYVWDPASNLSQKTVDTVTTQYAYDDIEQLLSESRPGYFASYTYDENGNRKTRAVLGGAFETYNYDSGDKLTSVTWLGGSKSYTYDGCGRTRTVTTGAGTTTLNYDYESRITSLVGPTTSTIYGYNGLNTRISRTSSVDGNFTYKRDGVGVTSPLLSDGTAKYTPGASSERRGTDSSFRHSNYLGSTSQITNGSQTVTALYVVSLVRPEHLEGSLDAYGV